MIKKNDVNKSSKVQKFKRGSFGTWKCRTTKINYLDFPLFTHLFSFLVCCNDQILEFLLGVVI